MQSMRLQQVEQIFHAALEVEPEQVEALLKKLEPAHGKPSGTP